MIIDSLVSRGWEAFTLPHGKKAPPPEGWTGKSKTITEEMQYAELEKEVKGEHNIGLTLPIGVVGIDVDKTETQAAKSVREKAREAWRVSSGDGEERFTAFFTLPEETKEEELRNIPGVDLITHAHRYSVIYGIHPTGRKYRIFSPGAEADIYDFPAPEELPYMPEKIISLMRRGKENQGEEVSLISENAPERTERPVCAYQGHGGGNTRTDTRKPCKAAQRAYERGMRDTGQGSKHEKLIKIAYTLAKIAEKGHTVGSLRGELYKAFIEEAGRERSREAVRALQIIPVGGEECACSYNSSIPRAAYFVDNKMMESVSIERQEVEAEVYIRSSYASFSSPGQEKAWREKTARNYLLDLIKKESNREAAEVIWIERQERVQVMEDTRFQELIESITETQRERQICFLIGHGYKEAEIADMILVSKATVQKTKRKIRERAGSWKSKKTEKAE